ncbi:tetratricopeptide repeat-containing sensor histidine kinase [Flavobacterium taihuense]|uniref:histidine kinase n=1 Tax=Flavobacterium taihuense TaxID=2857508 RepID=A0ABS6XS29_9FLAO|nr:tetratricopeptide repeat protein [Flavobacterium taihuense]MBW4359167.1 tetratricopeptide repeat protein [Flavobacterium taihuense]
MKSFSIFDSTQILILKKYYYILILFLVVVFGCTKNKIASKNNNTSEDSLSSYLTLANDDHLPITYKKKYNQKAFAIIMNQKDDSINKVNLFKVANRYYNMNDWNGYLETSRLILERSKKSRDTVNMAKAYTYLGDYYSAQSISDSAYLYYFKAEKLYLNLNSNYNLAKTIFSKANLQFNERDYFNSEIAVFKALKTLKGENSNDLLYESYNLLGILYNEREEFDRALEYHNKALAIIDNQSLPSVLQSKASSLNNMGYVYLNLKNYKQAKSNFEEGLKQEHLFEDKPKLYAMLLDNLAYAKFKLKEWDELPDQFYRALKIRDSLHLTAGVIINKTHLSEYFASKNDTLKAVQYAKQALRLSRSTNRLRSILESLKQMGAVDPKNASKYSKEYILINDLLQKAERKMGEKFSRIEYETDEIKVENTNLEGQNKKLLLIFGSFIILAILLYTIKLQKVRQRELIFKQQQQQANAEIYNLLINQQNTIEINSIKERKRVARELHDGVLGRMFGVRINLDSLNKIKDDSGIERRLNYLSELKNIEQDIREISHNLNREKSELINNFVAIVTNLFEEQKKTYTTKFLAHIDPTIKWDIIDNTVKINLYRILQESLQNCNKYAKATKIKVEFKRQNDNLALKISDDGIGFNINRAKKGIGLQNIKTRTIECEGTLEIKSKKEEGTSITIVIPIQKTHKTV